MNFVVRIVEKLSGYPDRSYRTDSLATYTIYVCIYSGGRKMGGERSCLQQMENQRETVPDLQVYLDTIGKDSAMP